MARETLDESWYSVATIDKINRIGRMLNEIRCGGTKANSLVVNGPVDEALWDRLAAQTAEIGMIDNGLRDLDEDE